MKMNPYMRFAAALAACSFALPALAQTATPKNRPIEIYIANLQPMNTASSGHHTTGHARFAVNGDKLTITIDVKDAAPNIAHWQHFHGRKAGLVATCPTRAADKNGDGIIDLIETEPASGTTMVPFDNAPAAMDVAHGVYPKASTKGSYQYRESVSLEALSAAFAKAFDGQKLDLDKRVVLIHGVPDSTKLPATVQSLGAIPAQVTLPIACGKIERSAR